jgi:hypothetical protein
MIELGQLGQANLKTLMMDNVLSDSLSASCIFLWILKHLQDGLLHHIQL